MPIRLSAPITALALTTALTAPASADVISGTFTGIAANGSFFTGGGPPTDVTGSHVTGTFDLASVAGAVPSNQGPSSTGDYALPGGAVSYSFTVASINQTYPFGGGNGGGLPSGVDLADNGTTQTATLFASVGDPHLDAYVFLTGPEGSLFSSVTDVASLHTGPGVTLQSPFFFGVFQTGGATVIVNSVTLTSQAMPEPPAWTVLAASVVVLATAGLPGAQCGRRRVFRRLRRESPTRLG